MEFYKKERDIRDVFRHSKKAHQQSVDSETESKAGKYLFSIVPAAGYTLQTGFAAILSANLAFYNSTASDQKLSNIATSITYSQYEQTIIPFTVNIWTKNNKFNIISDNRYIQYPSDIYGLGGVRLSVPLADSIANKAYTVNFSGLKLHETFMARVAKNTYLGAGIFYDQFWDINALDSLHRNMARLLSRNLGTSELAVGMAFRFLYDSRLNQINSENGWYANLLFRPNFKFMGSDENWNGLQTDVRWYTHFPKDSKNVLAFWNFNWLTLGGQQPPFLLLPSTGWDDQYNTGRGYIQGRFRGKDMVYYENEYRFRITNDGLLGGVLFGNVEYFSPSYVNQKDILSVGYGLGLRIKINKYSGTNLCVDYGFGENGSRGFFVNLGEVF